MAIKPEGYTKCSGYHENPSSLKNFQTIRFPEEETEEMTYQRIFDLKFKEDVPTYKLGRRYPKERRKISRIALLELPLSHLRELIKREKEFRKLISLKQWLFKKEEFRKKESNAQQR